jgi:protein-S-isoprenylcysteine O-methyltransferase Ste14
LFLPRSLFPRFDKNGFWFHNVNLVGCTWFGLSDRWIGNGGQVDNSPLSTPKGGKLALPRWAIPLVWAILVGLILIVVPWTVSRLGPRYGWSEAVPASWNLAGLVAVAAGLTLYVWCLVFHFKSYRAAVRVGFAPPHLVVGGPYQVSRNPMYVAGLFAWLGWAVFYGSPAVAIGWALLWALFSFRVIPGEERQLEALFGDEYLAYKRSVRRWLGRR